jgi:hypothetical protein
VKTGVYFWENVWYDVDCIYIGGVKNVENIADTINMSHDEFQAYMGSELDEYEKSVRNGTAVYITQEEFFEGWDRKVEELTKNREIKKCAG